MTTITITGKKPGKTDVTISSTVNPAVKTIVPVTVKSRNLLAYGPASANGLTATVNSDGSLHVTGTASRQWAGLSWTFPCPVQGIVTLSASATIKGLDVNAKCLDGNGQQLGSQITMASRGYAIPDGTVSLRLYIISNEATPTAQAGDLRIQLESGTEKHDWMRPDNTSFDGGGYELANLYPRVTGLPKTLGADPGITVTEPTPGTYRFKGSTTQAAASWTDLHSSVHVEAGTYTMDATDWPLGSDSWLIGIQTQLIPDDGSGQTDEFSPRSYGPRTLKAGTLTINIFINTTGEVDKTFTPRLYKTN
jgi:hypothetical protein